MKRLNLLAVAQAALAISLVVLAMAVVVPPPRAARTIAARSVPRSSYPVRDVPPAEERWRDQSLPPSERAAAAIARFDGNPTTAPDRTPSNDRPSQRRSSDPRPVDSKRAAPRPPVERVAERERTFDAPPRREPPAEVDADRVLPPEPVEPLTPVGTAATNKAISPEPVAPRIELGPVDDAINGGSDRRPTTKTFAAALSGTNDERWIKMRIVVEQPEPRAAAVAPAASSLESPAAARLDARLDVLKSQLEAIGREQEMRQQLQLERTNRLIERQQHSSQLLDIERRLLELRSEISAQKGQAAPATAPKSQPAEPIEPMHEIHEEVLSPFIQRMSADLVLTEVTDARRQLPQISPGPSSQQADPQAGGPYGSNRIPVSQTRETLSQPTDTPTPADVSQPPTDPGSVSRVDAPTSTADEVSETPPDVPTLIVDPIPQDLFDDSISATPPSEFPAEPLATQNRVTGAVPELVPTSAAAPVAATAPPARPMAGPNATDNKSVARAQYYRARDLLRDGNPGQARLHCDRAIELDPELADARRLRQEIDAALTKPQRSLFNWPKRSR